MINRMENRMKTNLGVDRDMGCFESVSIREFWSFTTRLRQGHNLIIYEDEYWF